MSTLAPWDRSGSPGTGRPGSRRTARPARPAGSPAGKARKAAAGWALPPREALRVPGGFDIDSFDRASTPGFVGDRKVGEALAAGHGAELSDLQERLYADGRSDGSRSVLLVLQGMDTAGKGGIVRHVVGMVDPAGVRHTSFGVPTAEERRHNYLWRIKRALPRPGQLGVFDRSHYEDVLVVRVDSLVPKDVWEKRYDEINAWEAKLVESGITMVKVAMLVSRDEQKARLAERLARPDKYWKYNPGDLDSRSKWPAYQEAYQAVLDRTNTEAAPWHVVPADRKWFARLAITELLLDAMRGQNLEWPSADFDVAHERARLAEMP